MYQELTSAFNGFFLVTGLLALALNAILIYIALNIHARRREINFAIALAFIDMVLPTLAVADSLVYFAAGIAIKENPLACTFQGPLHFFLPVFSMTLVTIIALERHAAVFGTEPWRRIPLILYISCAAFLVVNVLLSVFNGYDTGKSGIRCNPLPNSFIPLIMTAMLLSMLTFLLVTTIACYVRILRYATQVSYGAKTTQLLSESHQRKRRGLLIRIGTTSLVYFLLISPTCVLIPVEFFSPQRLREAICIAIYFTLFLVSVANPCLILFAHSTFYHRLCSLLGLKS